VIIVTRNRAAALERTALPALVQQTCTPCEILVWDASDGDDSRAVVERFAAARPALGLRWVRAPRRGSSSQRNDSLREVRGDLVLFLDDDAALSAEGLESIADALSDPEVAGAGLDIRLAESARAVHARRSRAELFFRRLFLLPSPADRPLCLSSGWNRYPLEPYAGEAQWICTCCAAFRREHLAGAPFEESLQRFGGYAFAEDLLLSQRIWRRGHRLVIPEKGSVFHDQQEGGRLESSGFWAARLYNGFVVWREAVYPYAAWTLPAYLWSAGGYALFLLASGLAARDWARLAGLGRGLAAIASDLFTGKGSA